MKQTTYPQLGPGAFWLNINKYESLLCVPAETKEAGIYAVIPKTNKLRRSGTNVYSLPGRNTKRTVINGTVVVIDTSEARRVLTRKIRLNTAKGNRIYSIKERRIKVNRGVPYLYAE